MAAESAVFGFGFVAGGFGGEFGLFGEVVVGEEVGEGGDGGGGLTGLEGGKVD